MFQQVDGDDGRGAIIGLAIYEKASMGSGLKIREALEDALLLPPSLTSDLGGGI